MNFKPKKGTLMFLKYHSVIYFITSVNDEIVEELYFAIKSNYLEINQESIDYYSKFYEEYYDDFKIYHNGEKI